MKALEIKWERDGIDPGWLIAPGVGSIRNSESYRSGGWWFLPDWLPDTLENDVGPFKTKSAAIQEAANLAFQNMQTK